MNHIYQNIDTEKILNEKKISIEESISKLVNVSLYEKNKQEREEDPYHYYESTLQQDPDFNQGSYENYDDDIDNIPNVEYGNGGNTRSLNRFNGIKGNRWGLNWLQDGGTEQSVEKNGFSKVYDQYVQQSQDISDNNKKFLRGNILTGLPGFYKKYDDFYRDPNPTFRNKGINKDTIDNYNLNDAQKEYLNKVVSNNKYFSQEDYQKIAQKLGELGPISFDNENGIRDLLKGKRTNWSLLGDMADGLLSIRKPEGDPNDFRNLSISNFSDLSSPYLGDIPVNYQGAINNEENIQNIII